MKHPVTTLASATLLGVLLMQPAMAQIAVKVGVLADMSGLYADIGGAGAVEAVRMAIEDFKPAGQGMTVDVVSADTQNKPDIAV
ncbi:MAG: transporter permease, partial [Tardiphaga sp.]|nr:transporter permease [Tardiphaga sp.]